MLPAREITRHHLRVRDIGRSAAFYIDRLGMRHFGMENGAHLFGYDASRCLLALHPGATRPYRSGPRGFYWKTGITLRNLDRAVAHLREQGINIGEPSQFRNIGYMTHLTDPDGFAIELLQQGFEGSEMRVSSGHPVSAQATLAHITLRVTDIEAARACFEDRLGMRLMSVQPVEPYDFCLYFYCWSAEKLPHADPKAVENREWLWARPYALIELQHLTGAGVKVDMRSDPAECGFGGFSHARGDGGQPIHVPVAELGSSGFQV